MVMLGLGRLVVTLKSKIRSLKLKKPYDKMEKSDSMRVEIRSRKARKLIEETLGRECTKNEKKNILVVERRIKGSIYDG